MAEGIFNYSDIYRAKLVCVLLILAYEEVILTENDLPTIVEELIEAQTKFYPLGTQLGVPVRKLETILMEHRNFSDCFINLIQEFLERGGATWRLIVKALRSKTVGMLALADKVEIAHIPHCFHESLGMYNKLYHK